jgi:hypothetical protein
VPTLGEQLNAFVQAHTAMPEIPDPEDGGRAAVDYGTPERMPANIINLLRQIGDPGQCQACGALIFWVRTKNGRSMPVSTAAVSHFADCPKADLFRRAYHSRK